jgi:hypothetical protein
VQGGSPTTKEQYMTREKFVLLFPLTFNDGALVPVKVLNDFKAELFVIAGGHTIAGTVKGEYRMKSGDKQVEDLLEIWVALEENDIPELRRVIGVYAQRLGQESMYFERTKSVVEFVPPLVAEGVKS